MLISKGKFNFCSLPNAVISPLFCLNLYWKRDSLANYAGSDCAEAGQAFYSVIGCYWEFEVEIQRFRVSSTWSSDHIQIMT